MFKLNLMIIILFFVGLRLNAQNDNIYTQVDVPPEPVASAFGWQEYIKKSLIYPEKAKELQIEGVVTVQFIVNKDGTIDKPLILRGIGGGCDEEAQRIVRQAPKWLPER